MTDHLSIFPVVIDLTIAWGEMDSFQHVNNVVYFRYFESARIAYFERMGIAKPETDVGPILAATSCRFKAPLTYPDVLRVGARVADVGADRFEMEYVIVSSSKDRLAARGTGLIVAYDYGSLGKAELPAAWREQIELIEGSKASS